MRVECHDVFFETTCIEMQDSGIKHIICHEIEFQGDKLLLDKEVLTDEDLFSRLEQFADFVPRPMIAIKAPQSSTHRPQAFWSRIGDTYKCEIGLLD